MATLGENRVRISFNPSAHPDVEKLKRMAADFIDACNEHQKTAGQGEAGRCLALAMTHAEDAAMWAVKGITA